ncbi:MAG TPA: amidohydrolase family protein [Bacteroidia bacterium]|nr:amidohydrolase family protein [Bacteroidia bacterium]
MRKLIFTLSLLVLCITLTKAQGTFPINGTHDVRHNYYAFTHAHIYQDYQTILDDATLLVKDGEIVDIGTNVTLPAGTVIIDCKNRIIYPSFIDLYTSYGMPVIPPDKRPHKNGATQMKSSIQGAYDWNQAVNPQTDAVESFHVNSMDASQYRNLGFGITLSSYHDGIVQGTSALVTLADTTDNEAVLQAKAAASYSFWKGPSSTQDYPSSLMGAIALIRQTYLDAEWYKNAKHKTEYNIGLEAFNNIQSLPQIFSVQDKIYALRADKIAREFNVKYIIRGSGDEFELLDAIKSTGKQFIIPVNFSDRPNVQDPYDAIMINYSNLLQWELSPLNPGALEKAGITFALTTDGLKDKSAFWANLRKAIKYGLSAKEALKALTYTPAEMMNMQDKVGSLKKGMMANFIITSGDIFKQPATIYSNWIKGNPYQVNDTTNIDLKGNYTLTVGNGETYTLQVRGETNTLSAAITDGSKHSPAYIHLSNPMITVSFRSSSDSLYPIQLSGVLSNDHKSFSGTGVMHGTQHITWQAVFASAAPIDSVRDIFYPIPSLSEVRYPFQAYGRTKTEEDSVQKVCKEFVIKNATVWTGESDTALTATDVYVKDGKIEAIGKNLSVPKDATVIDGTGKYVTAGIIDEHSHIAIMGGVNEGTGACSSEVRIGDVINSEDISIYRSLAGGVTACQLLHGSANPIGGQSGIIKLRWGMIPEQLKIQYAVPFIKFALGENVKQSNWGEDFTVRYPQSRMGVEQFYYDRFTKAKEYEATWNAYKKLSDKEKGSVDAPRRDLQMDALVEILNGQRFITCHSYVQSEINMLMHVADSMHFHMNTFTHGLEAYKLADKLAVEHIGVSTFADWWAYKMEVMEAIPFNAAITTKMGIVTAINSDDDEMQRRLNQEAGKTVKYGGLTEQQAWRTVTLNPAKLLHLDAHTGSLKVGKDADIVLWSANPLSIYAMAEKTFVDGICEFDRQDDIRLRKEIAETRADIINHILLEATGKAVIKKNSKLIIK